MAKLYTIFEHEAFKIGEEEPGYVGLDTQTFQALKMFTLENQNETADGLDFLGISARKGIGEILVARNYVGIISLKNGVCIEILPKIFSSVRTDKGKGTEKLAWAENCDLSTEKGETLTE
ncbi:MAG: hypothetical protein Q4C70_10185, partial [Planctomycetia bacterium]|nr:hypothetical protein [Planctomycetia bacterium]